MTSSFYQKNKNDIIISNDAVSKLLIAYFAKLVVQLNQPRTLLRVSTAANIERSRRELSKSGPLSLRVPVAQIL